MRRNPRHPGIRDAESLPEEGRLVAEPVDLGPEPDPAVPLFRGPRHYAGEGVVTEGEDVEDRGFQPANPAARQGQSPAHRGLSEDSLVEQVTEIVNC